MPRARGHRSGSGLRRRGLRLRGRSAAAAAGRCAPPCAACSMSRFTIRPPGPLPCSPEISTPASVASRRASGDAFTRPPSRCPLLPPPDCTTEGCPSPVAARVFESGVGVGAAPFPTSPPEATASTVSLAGASVVEAACDAVASAAPVSADTSSSAPAITAITVPTFAVSPSAIIRLRSTPDPRATSSMVALSVSTSARRSPSLTSSPSFLSQVTSRPSSIVGESASM